MAEILHRIGAKAPQDRTYEALSTREGLAAWWTNRTQGEAGRVGGVLQFRFEAGGFDMKVTALEPGALVRWQVVDGPAEWIGTTIEFELRTEGAFTLVHFSHRGWKEPSDGLRHCSTKWAVFLLSLKTLLETGTGAPEPNDTKIDNWN